MLRKYSSRKAKLEEREKQVSMLPQVKYCATVNFSTCHSIYFISKYISFHFIIQWKYIHQEKPNASVNHIHDIIAIEEAKRTIGDYKLKTSLTFDSLSETRDTLLSKHRELFNCWKKVFAISANFVKDGKNNGSFASISIFYLILFLR